MIAIALATFKILEKDIIRISQMEHGDIQTKMRALVRGIYDRSALLRVRRSFNVTQKLKACLLDCTPIHGKDSKRIDR
jgi:hypothetical protein